jgi:hypothetical protein
VELYVYASGGDTANLQVFLLGFFEEVYGVGTQKRTFTQTGLAVAAAGSQTFDLTGFLNRAFIRSLVIQETGGLVSGTYDFLVTGKDTHLDADKQYLAEDIDPASDYEDYLGWFYEDEDGTSELHLKITNNDTVSQATFTITLVAEQFA